MKRTATKYAMSQRKRKLKVIKARASARRTGGGGVSSSPARKPADLKDYSGDPIRFLGDFFSGGAFRK